jgi:hypothetical protein
MMLAWREIAMTLLVVMALPVVSEAIPPAICRQTMAGVFTADDGRSMRVALRLRMRSDENDISITGRFRCTEKRARERCFIAPANVSAAGMQAFGFRLAQATHRFTLSDPDGVVCELTATTPFVRDLCVPALGGRFTCQADGGADSASGAFGLAVDSCRPCLSRQP